jgi:retron-type reverse transcriptase
MQYTKTNLINIRQYLKNRRKNCCNMIDDCNVTMVTSISPQHYQKETKMGLGKLVLSVEVHSFYPL